MTPNFQLPRWRKLKFIQGPKLSALDVEEYSLDPSTEVVIIHHHSPYPEVRAVTDPVDDKILQRPFVLM